MVPSLGLARTLHTLVFFLDFVIDACSVFSEWAVDIEEASYGLTDKICQEREKVIVQH